MLLVSHRLITDSRREELLSMPEPHDALPSSADMPLELLYAKLAGLIDELDIKQASLAAALGVSPPVISNGVNKQTGLDSHWVGIVDFLATKYRIAPNWFLRNEGPKFLGDPTESGSASATHRALKAPSESFPNPQHATAMRETAVLNFQHKLVEFEISKPRPFGSSEIIQVQPEDMAPVIRSGQWVILAPQSRLPHDGDIVVLTTEENTWVRRIRTVPGHDFFMLEAANQAPHVRTVHVKKEEVRRVSVVVGVLFE